MSEATLAKIQLDCTKMEAELAIYTKSQPLSTACESIITHIASHPEPFSAGPRSEPNPWHASGGGGGGCTLS